jgi:molecular chaperone GrpE
VDEEIKENQENQEVSEFTDIDNNESEIDDMSAGQNLENVLKEKERFQSIAQRAQADLVNYRSRVIQEQEEIRRTVKFGLLSRFIGIMDDLERAVNEMPDNIDKGWGDGVLLVLRNLENALDIEGVKKVEALGELFDPHKHEALLYEKTTQSPEGTILNVIQNGYTLNDKILRPARVIVAQEDSENPKIENNKDSENDSD